MTFQNQEQNVVDKLLNSSGVPLQDKYFAEGCQANNALKFTPILIKNNAYIKYVGNEYIEKFYNIASPPWVKKEVAGREEEDADMEVW